MRIVKLQGGLGNQLFQYAFAKALGDDVLFDISSYSTGFHDPRYPRLYQLPHFHVEVQPAIEEEIAYCLAPRRFDIIRFSSSLLRLPKRNRREIREKNALAYEASLLKKRRYGYYIGYFQSERYFIHIRERLLQDFRLSTPISSHEEMMRMLEAIHATNAIALHIRRGDYQYSPIHYICDISYYEKAIHHIAERVENPHFFIFSDEISWVREHLHIPYPFTIVDINDAHTGYYDMELMRNCKHNIIANSTFSWWGAWLNENPNKIVVAPRTWLVGQEERVDIVPSAWVQM